MIVGDYEQVLPYVFSIVPYENIFTVAGSKGTFMSYNGKDGCCWYWNSGASPPNPNAVTWSDYVTAAQQKLNKQITFFADPDNQDHAMSSHSYQRLKIFLTGLGL